MEAVSAGVGGSTGGAGGGARAAGAGCTGAALRISSEGAEETGESRLAEDARGAAGAIEAAGAAAFTATIPSLIAGMSATGPIWIAARRGLSKASM
jgi:hypothetical protein